MQKRRNLSLDLVALALMVVAVFTILSLGTYHPADPPTNLVHPARGEPSNLCGAPGAIAAYGLLNVFGLGAYIVTGGVALAAVLTFSRVGWTDAGLRLIGTVMVLVGLCVVASWLFPSWGGGFWPATGAGGYVGTAAMTFLERYFSSIGIWLVSGSVLFVGLILVGDYLVIRFFAFAVGTPVRWLGHSRQHWDWAREAVRSRVSQIGARGTDGSPRQSRRDDSSADDDFDNGSDEAASEATSPAAVTSISVRVNTPANRGAAAGPSEGPDLMAALEAASLTPANRVIPLPSLDLLEPAEEFPYEMHEKQVRRKGLILEKTFRDFGYQVKVVEIDTGPVITQFEIELEPGLRLSKITSLADDLAIALRVPSVRVVAPIPGKNTVGIELPNDRRALVRMREVIEGAASQISQMRIPLFLGKDVSGNPLLGDLTEMPHLLIAGRTGTGKSVCLHSMILSILMTRGPDAVRMLMIDPKMVELSPYKRVPHLMHPVVTDMKKAEAILAWAVDKMEERYDLLARTGVRHIDLYNQLGEEEIFDRLGPMDDEERARIPTHMPYIVIFGDEIADLMMSSAKEVEGYIIRLAQKSRAVGVHLVLATQKPTVDVITGLIKSNLPARISFQVASRSDSRVVLDEIGAERLLGDGDMLFLLPGTSTLIRAQGTYVCDDEIRRVTDCLSDSEPQYVKELVQLKVPEDGESIVGPSRERDEFYPAAVEIVIREGRGSVSLLQRALGIGYGRAARLIDYMAEDGIVGEYNGSQAREVLFTPEQWEALRAGREEEAMAT